MSRSYKKNLILKDSGSYHRFCKNQANRKIRRTPEVPDGKAYRKFYCSYNITDWCMRYNPYPWTCWNYRTGELEWVDPDPIYRWRMK